MFWYFTNQNKFKPCLKTGAKGVFLVCDPNSTPEGIEESGETRKNSNDAEVSATNVLVGSLIEKDPKRVLFGKILRKIRKIKGMSIYELARVAQVDAGYISRLENAHRNPPSPRILQRFADALGVKIDLLMIAAGYLEYNGDGERYTEAGVIQLIERELVGDDELPRAVNVESTIDNIGEEYSKKPFIQTGALCRGVTDDGTVIVGTVMLIVANVKNGAVPVSEITHLLESPE